MIKNWLRNNNSTNYSIPEDQVVSPEHDLSNVSSRLLAPDGSFNVSIKGSQSFSIYHLLMNSTWANFMLSIFIIFVLINFIFALMFYAVGVQHVGIEPSTFLMDVVRAFHFSIQTFVTLGFGRLSPTSDAADAVASLDAFVGILTAAILTGLFFARFAKPKSFIEFSQHVIIGPDQEGRKCLQMRAVNAVNEKIIDLQARVTMTWLENDGERIRRKFKKLPLQIDSIFLFPLNWNLIHTIDKDSPLYGLDEAGMKSNNVELLVVIKGFDETYNAIVHSDRSYQMSDLIYGAEFKPMYTVMNDETILHLDHIDKTVPAEVPED